MKSIIYGSLIVLLSSCSNNIFFANQSLNEHEIQIVKPLIVPATFELPAVSDPQTPDIQLNNKVNSKLTEELIKR